ncbi:unnamed protein product [Ixodes pacificus]
MSRQAQRRALREAYKQQLIQQSVIPRSGTARSPTPPVMAPPPGYQFLPPNCIPIVPVGAIPAPGQGVKDPSPPPRRAMASETTVIVNRAAQTCSPRPTTSPVVIQIPTEEHPDRSAATPRVVRMTAPALAPVARQLARDGNKQQMHASIKRAALSLDEMFETLSSPRRSRSRPRRRWRRARTFDFDDEDDTECSECRLDRYHKTYPYARRRRASAAVRRCYDEDDLYSRTYRTPSVSRRRRGASRERRALSRKRTPTRQRRRARSDGDIRYRQRRSDSYESFHDMVSRSLDQIRRRSRSARVLQMGGRIRTLIQNILQVSREVIRARRAIQMGGQRGEHNLRNIFAAESKLKELIDLESELADELASWRRSDFESEDDYFAELQRMEDKVRRLIDVERRLVREIRGWRKGEEPIRGSQPSFFGIRPAVPVMFREGSRPHPDLSTPSLTTTTGTTEVSPTSTSSTSVTPSSSRSSSPTSSSSETTKKTKSKGRSKKRSKKKSKKKSRSKKKSKSKSRSKRKSKSKSKKSKKSRKKSKSKKKKSRKSKSKSK